MIFISLFKIDKTKDFTIMSNFHLRDKNLSLKAKGLLSFMLSLPDDWDYSLMGLCAICKESKDAIRSTLKELQKYNYLEIEKVRGDKGYFEYNYLIYEKPKCIDQVKTTSKPNIGNPYVEKQIQKITNNKIDKDDKTMSSFFVAEEHNILTLELINRGYIDEMDTQIFYYDDLFIKLLNYNNSYKDLLKIVHYIIPRVKSRYFKDEDGEVINNKFGYFKSALISNIEKLNFSMDSLYDD